MRRLFWVALGATAGVLVVRRLGRVAQAYGPEGLATSMQHSLATLTDATREFAAAVREGMAEREDELRVALGIDAGKVDPDAADQLIQDPTGRHEHVFREP